MTKTYPISDSKFFEAKILINQNGGTINPNNWFEIQGVEGTFHKGAESITITVTKKPWLASWKKIEKTLDEFFAPWP